ATFHFKHEVTVANNISGEIAIVRLKQPFFEFSEFGGIHSAAATNVIGRVQFSPATLGFWRRKVCCLVSCGCGGKFLERGVDHWIVRGALKCEGKVLVEFFQH